MSGGPAWPGWLMMSAIVRRMWRSPCGRRALDQEFLQEKMLEYLPLNHFLDLNGGVAATEIQAPANDLDARRQVGVAHRKPDGKKGKEWAQLRKGHARSVGIPTDIGPRQQQPVFLRLGLEGEGHPNQPRARRLLGFRPIPAQRAIKRLHECGEGKVHQNSPGAYSRSGQPADEYRPQDENPGAAQQYPVRQRIKRNTGQVYLQANR